MAFSTPTIRFVCSIRNVKYLGNLCSKNKSLRFVTSKLIEINTNESVLVRYNAPFPICPTTTEKWHFETQIVQLPYLLYLTIVHTLVFTIVAVSIYTYTTILINAFLVLINGIER